MMAIQDRINSLETRSAVQSERIDNVEQIITDHVRECRESRREARMWFMGIIGTILAAACISWFKFSQ